jgi:rhamnosyltransferase
LKQKLESFYMVSIVIPTFNAGKHIHKLLSSIQSQTISCEIIVIDSSSTDNTTDISESFGAKIISIKKENFNHGRTRNLAALQTKGEIIVFLTQDVLPCNKFCIELLTKPLENPEIAACYGRQIPADNAMPTERFARLFNYPETPLLKGLNNLREYGIKTYFFSNALSAIRRKEFEELGGFHEDIIMFEDILFAAKLIMKDYKIAYIPEAKVIHSHNLTWSEQFKRYFYAGISFKKNPLFLRYAKADKEGGKFLKNEIEYFVRNKAYYWIIYALIESIFKYSGYILGINYDKIPCYFTKKYRKLDDK